MLVGTAVVASPGQSNSRLGRTSPLLLLEQGFPRSASGGLCLGGYRLRRANPTEELRPIGSSVRQSFQNHLNILKVLIMRQTEVSAPDFSPVAAPTFTRAAIRFVTSLAALIGVSLLLASL
jgi:hypothetical protein